MGKPIPMEIRFWHHVKKTEKCWIWLGAKNSKGYGVVRLHRKRANCFSHRISYEMHKGIIPTGKLVLHTCDNPSCVNPEHLWLGTPLQNSSDMRSKGRNKPGTQRYNAKLTEADIPKIRKSKNTNVYLAKKFGVSNGIISEIKNFKRWKHVK